MESGFWLPWRETFLCRLGPKGERPTSFSRNMNWGPAELLSVHHSHQLGERERRQLRSQVWDGDYQLQEQSSVTGSASCTWLLCCLDQCHSCLALQCRCSAWFGGSLWGPRRSQKPSSTVLNLLRSWDTHVVHVLTKWWNVLNLLWYV